MVECLTPWWASIGGGGGNIKCPPPPTILGLYMYDYSLKWGPCFWHPCEVSGAVRIFFFFFFFWVVREVGDVPDLCLENGPKNFEVGKKKCRSHPPPPPPPPPPVSFFRTCATFEAGGGLLKKNLCVRPSPPPQWSGSVWRPCMLDTDSPQKAQPSPSYNGIQTEWVNHGGDLPWWTCITSI